MFGPNVVVVKRPSFIHRQLDGLLGTGGEAYLGLGWVGTDVLGGGLVGAVLLPLFRFAFFRCRTIFGSDRFWIDEFLGEGGI